MSPPVKRSRVAKNLNPLKTGIPLNFKFGALVQDHNLVVELECCLHVLKSGPGNCLDEAFHRSLQEIGFASPSDEASSALRELNNHHLGALAREIRDARNFLLSGGVGSLMSKAVLKRVGMKEVAFTTTPLGFWRCPEGMLFGEYLVHRLRFLNGGKVTVSNFITSKGGKRTFTTEAVSHVRSIAYEHNVPIRRLPSLWSKFAVLMLRQPLLSVDATSHAQIKERMMHVDDVDQQLFCKELEKHLLGLTPRGFKRCWYMMSDDSKHKDKENHHVLVMSCLKNVTVKHGVDGKVEKSFQFLCASMAGGKASLVNANKNVEVFKRLITPAMHAHFGGGCSDNANDAQKELKITFEAIQTFLETAGEVNRATWNGVSQRVVIFGDPCHIDK